MARLLAAALGALLVACAGGAPPEWRRLDEDYRADAVAHDATDLGLARLLGREVAVARAADHAWIEVTLARADWVLRRPPAQWAVTVGLAATGQPAEGEPYRLTGGGRDFPFKRRSMIRPDKALDEGVFQLHDGAVVLQLADGEEPPERAVLGVYAGRGGADAGGWRVRGERFSGRALSVWPGERWSTDVALAAPGTLRFRFVVEPLVLDPPAGASVRFRVTAGEAELLTGTLPAGAPADAAFEAPLPVGATRLTFAVEGTPAYSGFFAPVIAPAERGDYAARPWAEERPHLVVFQADTFRADNLAAYGSTDAVTPRIDAFAERARVYARAWSVGTYTLPAHATMFGGVFPRQAGILGTARALPEALDTIAELLHARGYRTGAITDSVILSSRYAMDQGFEWFEEHPLAEGEDAIDRTVRRARAFLDADDGRPVFLFVQTYRAHLPYRVRPETLAALGPRLGITETYAAWNSRLASLGAGPPRDAAERELRRSVFAGLRAHYLGGVHDLDAGFGRFLDDLEGRALLEAGVLVFTSDHGEAFGEHGVAYHTGRVFEEQTRVPLLLAGRGVAPGVVAHGASLVDLAPTLARLAGVPQPPLWLGTPLLELESERPLFLFECKRSADSTLAIVHGTHKLLGFEDPERLAAGRALAAFDLQEDPLERTSVLSSAAWPRDLLERWGADAALLLDPVVGSQAAQLDLRKLQELRDLGYGGQEE